MRSFKLLAVDISCWRIFAGTVFAGSPCVGCGVCWVGMACGTLEQCRLHSGKSSREAQPIDTHEAVAVGGGSDNLSIAATVWGKTAEHIVEVRCVPAFTPLPALHLAACSADDEVSNFKSVLVRILRH